MARREDGKNSSMIFPPSWELSPGKCDRCPASRCVFRGGLRGRRWPGRTGHVPRWRSSPTRTGRRSSHPGGARGLRRARRPARPVPGCRGRSRGHGGHPSSRGRGVELDAGEPELRRWGVIEGLHAHLARHDGPRQRHGAKSRTRMSSSTLTRFFGVSPPEPSRRTAGRSSHPAAHLRFRLAEGLGGPAVVQCERYRQGAFVPE